jgi:hypothetical protein
MSMLIEEVLQKDDADVDCGDHVNDQKWPFDCQKDGILICHVSLLFLFFDADCEFEVAAAVVVVILAEDATRFFEDSRISERKLSAAANEETP